MSDRVPPRRDLEADVAVSRRVVVPVLAAGLVLAGAGLVLGASDAAVRLLLSAVAVWKQAPPAPHWPVQLRLLAQALVVVGTATALASTALFGLGSRGAIRGATFLLIWLLLVFTQFSLGYAANEYDILPVARQFFDRGWLPADWYLNLHVGYRVPFNVVTGGLVSTLGFQEGAYAGRLLGYAVFALALQVFLRTFRVSTPLALLALLWFLAHQSLVAGEWMVGGTETKTIAYASVLLSLAAFLRRRYPLGFAYAGAALSFHVLVGLYALFCTGVAFLLAGDLRTHWRRALGRAWPLLLTGAFGLAAVADQLRPHAGADGRRGWELYVRYRVPHHTVPSSWAGSAWVAELGLLVAFLLACYLLARRIRAMRFLAAYGLGSALLFGIGMLVAAFGDVTLLRFYWFRFPDVMLPFVAVMLAAMAVERFAVAGPPAAAHRRAAAARTGASAMVAAATVALALQWVYALRIEAVRPWEHGTPATGTRPMLHWIAEHSPHRARFLVDPTMAEFYVEAQRAMLVSFKHLPQSAAAVVEWYRRLVLCNGGRTPTHPSFDSQAELRAGFYALDADQIRRIADEYDLDFVVGASPPRLPFEQVYRDARFTVYRLDAGT